MSRKSASTRCTIGCWTVRAIEVEFENVYERLASFANSAASERSYFFQRPIEVE
jgi:hypothetical protein